MKIAYSRTLTSLLLIALIIGANGCMTQSAVKYGNGHPDKAWINNKFDTAYLAPDPNTKPHPAYYALIPLSFPADVATSPFQLIVAVIDSFLAGVGNQQ
jgi:hypothetical protein